MTNPQQYSGDKAIRLKQEDKFQRYGFAQRIAQTISQRGSDEGLVVGIYGAWGEGKTSILHFIEQELLSSKDIVVVKYNPWRFTGEDNLLKSFFEKLALALDESLTNVVEKIGGLLKQYAGVLNVAGINASAAADSIVQPDIEKLKERIEKILKENNRRVVVIIDDIDRLEKKEIHAIFRLVKLNGDFKNTTYILSFDEKMVAQAIGENYGNGKEEAGRNFLEKIIQVPLQIPVAQPDALKKYCYELVERTLQYSGIALSEEEGRRFAKEFNTGLLSALLTPRLAVRFCNSISFSVPLLKGEVNVVDLMLLEGVKAFYPSHYEFIKNNIELFMNSYDDQKRDTDIKKEQLSKGLDELGSKLTNKRKKVLTVDLP